jgi:glycosyltransferase involved in cell wall biosynthesis
VKIVLGVGAIKTPLTGIARYTMELAYNVPQVEGITTIKFFSRNKLLSSNAKLLKPRLISAKVRNWILDQSLLVKSYQLLNPLRQKYALRNCEDYLYHGPNFYLPPFPGRSVVTIHDLSVYTWPECHPESRVRYMQSEIEKTLKRADMVITDSEFNRKELIDYFSWPSSKIISIPLASGENYFPRAVVELTSTLNFFGLTNKCYALFVGTIEPRKNLKVLLDAYESMPLKQRLDMPLVIAGFYGWKSNALHERLKNAENQGWLRYLGYVAEEHLPMLFCGAKMFLFPSHYEGFGLPILEAMACGTPVISSNAASMLEVGGNAAIFINPDDVDLWRQNIQRLSEDNELNKVKSDLGILHAANFTWQKTAIKTVDVYRKTLST